MANSASDLAPTAVTTAARNTPAEWLSHVREVQQSRIRPDQRAVILQRAEAQRSMNHVSLQSMAIGQRADEAVYLTRRAHTSFNVEDRMEARERLQQRSAAYSSAWHDSAALQQQVMRSRAEDERSRYDEAVETNMRTVGAARMLRRVDDDSETVHGAAVPLPPPPPPPPAQLALPGDGLVTLGLPAARADDSNELLESLRREPPTDSECSQKFESYEFFSTTVTDLRTQLDEVAKAAAAALPAGDAREAVASEVARLDRAENTGVFDESRNWFVYDMAKQTISNCSKIRGLSEKIAARVKFAAENAQDECPVCLDKFTGPDGAVAPKMLSCCHMVCVECWRNWVAVSGGNVFCPLCRHEEFVDFIVRAGPQ